MLFYAAFVVLVVLVLVLILFVKFADADLTLLWKKKFGKTLRCLEGKVIWITGASSGIGEHLAYEFSKINCRLVLTSRNKDALNNVKRQCLTMGKISEEDILVLPMDVCNFSYHKEAVDIIIHNFGCMDIIINNAGRSQRAYVVDTELAVDREMIELNVLAPISIIKNALPHMISNGGGDVVIVSSFAGKVGLPNSATYCLTKFAIEGWHQSLRIEMLQNNIGVTIVCPGPVHSNVVKNAFTGVSGKNLETIRNDDFKRMATSRCVELMAVAIANRLPEVWISNQPVLMMAYISRIWPTFSVWVNRHFGSWMTNLREGRS